ncbi:ATP-binding cassette domain-containing protein [Mucilaginibacter sp. ZT4R22]|uniref:ATP-binding cassette domain-containing protein n=1 Tax=Mucilaginibacter pankratovii TaxID=2772110 RepID=A0ABR7WN26_9SPHI|nr:ATP-binding cassette domain-containing protein [Mucilaginibacter pankratovii]MBD1362779.1 ATP-binding cassette domain-containing protein [Mucilaginibacter pankratovii]
MNLLFSLNKIIVKFAGHTAINQLSFAVNKGQHWVLTGNSGSGKSVLLQVIAGNISISGGTLAYNFTNGQGKPAIDFHPYIAFAGARHHFKNLANTSNFYYQQRYNSSDSEDALTAEQYLQVIKPNTHSPVYWVFEKTIAALNLQHLRDKQVIKLSNGETKRLMIAAALLKNPTLLLLDNPLTGLDAATRQYFNTLLGEISASGITLVMATSAHEIPDVISNVAVLDNGIITKTLNKQQFLADLESHPEKPNVDTDALKALISTNAKPHNYAEIVAMNNVVIRYGEKTILNHINWSVNPGERWALLGPNGAGKSTLLSLLNGDNPQAYANDIVLFDKKRGTGESIWDIKSKIGFVSPELYQYFPTDNSCLQVIESGFYDTLGLFRQSSPTKAALALSWMKALEIDKYARVLLKNIPASAQRLCLLARALIKNPALLIFDEPCQGLDDHQQLHFKTVVDTICSISNVTLIYVTHYQHEIPDSVDKVLRLDKGEAVDS